MLRIQKFLHRFRWFFRRFTPMQTIVLVFLAIILAGSCLLMLPISAKSREATPFLTALFTATSCTCVTGLSLVDTGTYWTSFGHAVMLGLIQIGGLGFMTVVTLFFTVMNRRIGLKERLVMAQSLGMEDLNAIVTMVKKVLVRTLIVECIGAVLLTVRFCFQMPLGKAMWWGVFHSVSAFCNAGFDIMGHVEAGGSLMMYTTDWAVNAVLIGLILVSGLGFFVWDDILKNRRFRKLSVYSRMVLTMTAILFAGGGVLFALLEWNNPATLGGLSVGEKLMASVFQSVTTRTAGFYTVPQGALTGASKAVTDVLMFIGGSSGSTAGGAKTVTIAVLVLSVAASARGSSRVTVFRRTVQSRQISDAVAVVGMMFAVAFAGAVYLSAANGLNFADCIYETISAIATVGLSTGLTASVNLVSKLLLIVMMFFGRVGVMTISLGFLLSNRAEERYSWAETKLLIG